MKKSIAILALVAGSAQASICPTLATSAEKIMDNRQTGVPLSRMMEIAKTAGDLEGILTSITLEAYNRPRYSTGEYQRNAIAEFRNEWEVRCYRVRGNK